MNFKKEKFFSYALIATILFFLFNRIWFLTPGIIENCTSVMIYPALVIQNKLIHGVRNFFEHKKNLVYLSELVEKLEQERDQLLAQNIELGAVLNFNEATQELINFKERYTNLETRIAQVLLKIFSDKENYFLVNQGSNHGVKKDMVAIYRSNLIGKVSEVFPNYSKVILVTDKSCKVAVSCMQTKSSGIHEGTNLATETKIKFISHLMPMKEQDVVLSSGEGLIFPEGFALGKIESFELQGLCYNVKVKPLIDLKKINHCFLAQKGEDYQ